jgi:hypothetical protein
MISSFPTSIGRQAQSQRCISEAVGGKFETLAMQQPVNETIFKGLGSKATAI